MSSVSICTDVWFAALRCRLILDAAMARFFVRWRNASRRRIFSASSACSVVFRSAARKAAGIDNVRVLRVETFYAVRYLLPAQSVEAFHLLFPDPWPKRRHHRRRIVTADFLKAAAAALTENGTCDRDRSIRIFWNRIRACADQSATLPPAKNGHDDFPASAFENRFKGPVLRFICSNFEKSRRCIGACLQSSRRKRISTAPVRLVLKSLMPWART